MQENSSIEIKQKLWERKLLDFSLRNALLNFRATRKAIRFMVADLGALEDGLADGADFRVQEAPMASDGVEDAEAAMRIAAEEFAAKRICTYLNEEELEKHLKGLYRSARTSMEENGTNTLYLALGFLRWYESAAAEKGRMAPLVLIPVDLVRRVRGRGYVLRSRQEEAQINITLLEYLRQEYEIPIEGLDPLPEDEHGIDLGGIFAVFREAIAEQTRWEIDEQAYIGLFSFAQFVMWNDLRNRSDELVAHPVVHSLMRGAMSWQPEAQMLSADRLDAELSVRDMAVPVSADSSQLVAIAAAAGGQSFVLHGPPGTGKSQTITNMIANALFQGKSVLFVAEKMAALSVVQKRLADIGLDPFCLELHSNKTNKSSVLAELERTLEVGRIRPPEAYEAVADRLCALKDTLNDLVDAVHQRRNYGISLYDAIERYEQSRDQSGKICFGREQVEGLSETQCKEWEELLRTYKVAIQELGIYREHPLVGYEGTVYSIELRDAFCRELSALMAEGEEALGHLDALRAWAGGIQSRSLKSARALFQMAAAAGESGIMLGGLLSSPNFDAILGQGKRLVALGGEYDALRSELEQQFDAAVFDYAAEPARLMWKQAGSAWALPRQIRQNKLLKELRLYAKNPAGIDRVTIEDIYQRLSLVQEKRKELSEVPAESAAFFSGLFLGTGTDWAAFDAALTKTAAVHRAIMELPPEERGMAIAALSQVGSDPACTEHGQRLSGYLNAVWDWKMRYQIDLGAQEADTDFLGAVGRTLARYRDHTDELRAKAAFNQIDGELRAQGLAAVSDAYKQGKVDANDLSAAYTAGLYYELILMTIAQDVRLASFRGKQYEDFIAQYRDAITQYEQLTIQELVARLSARIPVSGTAGAASSELGILKKAIKNNGRMLSLRRLFEQIPTLLRRLCPCMLMSPISVAQYIDPSFPKFDLVIFDEASQLPTSEAVGTIARGEHVVIVGDPKQLPPTNFFHVNHVDEENMEQEDLESLLDDCLAISMPQEYLKWHYRSRHESLIAYSNRTYYDNKLYTFPSPDDLNSKVTLVELDGVYDKGGTKQNRVEAEAIVAEIIRRLGDEKLREDSIGVVTFSSVQQNLIDDLLYEEFQKYPELEEYDRGRGEPVFIKNLENVQGDERDMILFSVGYGPDEKGNVSMNFGPLNRDGGWRRLNVAITRARKSMTVYSVLRAEQIDLSRTDSEGVAGLKGFLEFAARGTSVMAAPAEQTGVCADTVTQEIASAITGLGYETRCNIGCSEFRLDIAVMDPKEPDTYLLGVLLDGENCLKTPTARERFVLQPSVLRGLGWRLVRVWTLDWLDDRERVTRELADALTAAETAKEQVQIPGGEPSARDGQGEPDGDEAPSHPIFEKMEPLATEQRKHAYIPVMLQRLGTPEEFYLPATEAKICEAAVTVMAQEAPVSRRQLVRKLMEAWDITRGGSRVDTVMAHALAKVEKQITGDDDRAFFWRKDQNPEEYRIYRVEDAEGNRRDIEDIPSEEIRNAMSEVLEEQISLTKEDLLRETAKKFGFTRSGNVIDRVLDHALGKCMETGVIRRLENGKLVQAQ